jgi:hypothetical protein
MFGYRTPDRNDNFSHVIQSHFAIDDFTQQTGAILCADSNEIRSGPRIIVAFQPNGTAMMSCVSRHKRPQCVANVGIP